MSEWATVVMTNSFWISNKKNKKGGGVLPLSYDSFITFTLFLCLPSNAFSQAPILGSVPEGYRYQNLIQLFMIMLVTYIV